MKIYILIICLIVVGCAHKPVAWCKDNHCVTWKGKKVFYSYKF